MEHLAGFRPPIGPMKLKWMPMGSAGTVLIKMRKKPVYVFITFNMHLVYSS